MGSLWHGPVWHALEVCRTDLAVPPPIEPGARVAVVSPSWAAPERYPAIHEQALQRLRDGRRSRAGRVRRPPADPRAPRSAPGTSSRPSPTRPWARSSPPSAARTRSRCCATWTRTSCGSTRSRFLGYSDNTNLLNWLWFHGVAGFHGGSTQVHLGPGPSIHPDHLASLRAALFGGELVDHARRTRSREDEVLWDSPSALSESAPLQPAPPWTWHHADRVVTAPTWGGNIEILALDARPSVDGCCRTTPTEAVSCSWRPRRSVPSATEVYRTLRHLGERGLLEQFEAVVVARARASDDAERSAGRRSAVRRRATPLPRRPGGRRAAGGRGRTGRARWSSSESTSGIPRRSGCCRTAARSPSTVQAGGSSRGTDRT